MGETEHTKAFDALMTTENFTEREMSEIELARIYAASFNHGTDGHNRLLLINKLFEMLIEFKMKENE